MITDAQFMLAVLQERPGEWVTQNEILQRSISERGHGLTVHSRAATLREHGHLIENRVERRNGSRATSSYRLVLQEPPAREHADGSRSTTDSSELHRSALLTEDGGDASDQEASPPALFDLAPTRKEIAWA